MLIAELGELSVECLTHGAGDPSNEVEEEEERTVL